MGRWKGRRAPPHAWGTRGGGAATGRDRRASARSRTCRTALTNALARLPRGRDDHVAPLPHSLSQRLAQSATRTAVTARRSLSAKGLKAEEVRASRFLRGSIGTGVERRKRAGAAFHPPGSRARSMKHFNDSFHSSTCSRGVNPPSPHRAALGDVGEVDADDDVVPVCPSLHGFTVAATGPRPAVRHHKWDVPLPARWDRVDGERVGCPAHRTSSYSSCV